MRVEGPLIIVQILETTLLTLVNYARYYIILLFSVILINGVNFIVV